MSCSLTRNFRLIELFAHKDFPVRPNKSIRHWSHVCWAEIRKTYTQLLPVRTEEGWRRRKNKKK